MRVKKLTVIVTSSVLVAMCFSMLSCSKVGELGYRSDDNRGVAPVRDIPKTAPSSSYVAPVASNSSNNAPSGSHVLPKYSIADFTPPSQYRQHNGDNCWAVSGVEMEYIYNKVNNLPFNLTSNDINVNGPGYFTLVMTGSAKQFYMPKNYVVNYDSNHLVTKQQLVAKIESYLKDKNAIYVGRYLTQGHNMLIMILDGSLYYYDCIRNNGVFSWHPLEIRNLFYNKNWGVVTDISLWKLR